MANSPDGYINLVVKEIETTIQSGEKESGIIDLRGTTLKTIKLPPVFTGTTLTFKVAHKLSDTFVGYYNVDNLAVSITCTQNREYGLGVIDFFAIQYLKIISNLAETGNRDIKLLVRGI